ncbi:hypothetical protein P2318_30385 [Myxococcaceae bacterium GXIMD 01537]
MRRLLLCAGLLLLPLASLAQEDALLPAALEDGGTADAPDGSVGNGGADRDNEEGDDHTGRVVTSCRSSRDCSPRFSCDKGTCRYTGVRQAERVGCLLGPEAALVLVGLTLAAVHRRNLPKE